MSPDTSVKNRDYDPEITLKDFLNKLGIWYHYLLSQWLLILAVVVLGAALGFFYAFQQKPTFTATCTFVLDDGGSSGGLGQYAGLASLAGIDLGGGGGDLFQGDNLIELYKSRSMVKTTLLTPVEVEGKKQLLIDRFIAFNQLREGWAKNEQLKNIQFDLKPGAQFSRLQDSVISKIVDMIKTNNLNVSKPDKKLSIIMVVVKAKDEPFAKLFNDAIVRNVNDFYVKTKTKKAVQNIQILQQKTDSVRNTLYGSINMAASVADATPNLNPTMLRQRVAPVQRYQVSAEANKLILSELIKNLELSKISLRKETPLIQVLDEPYYPLEVVKFGKLKGIVLGGFLFGCLAVIGLITKKVIRESLA